MKSFKQGQAVTVRCAQLKADDATASIKMTSGDMRSLVLEFSTPVLVHLEGLGVLLGQYTALIQDEDGFRDLHGNPWEVE